RACADRPRAPPPPFPTRRSSDLVMLDQRERVDDIADRLGHLLAAVEHETVAEDALRQWQARRHQECRPIDRVETRNVLADHVQIDRKSTRLNSSHVKISYAVFCL